MSVLSEELCNKVYSFHFLFKTTSYLFCLIVLSVHHTEGNRRNFFIVIVSQLWLWPLTSRKWSSANVLLLLTHVKHRWESGDLQQSVSVTVNLPVDFTHSLFYCRVARFPRSHIIVSDAFFAHQLHSAFLWLSRSLRELLWDQHLRVRLDSESTVLTPDCLNGSHVGVFTGLLLTVMNCVSSYNCKTPFHVSDLFYKSG